MTDGRKIGVFGTSGFGKSTLVKRMLKDRPRVIVFDPLDEYAAAGLARFTSGSDLRSYIARHWHSERWQCAYIPRAGDERREAHAVAQFLVGDEAGGNGIQQPYKDGDKGRLGCSFVIEEMDMSFPVQSLPADLNGMAMLSNRGRHYGVEMIGVSQFPAQVSKTFRANAAEVFSFFLADEDHRGAMLKRIGPEHRDALATLRPHEYLRYADGEVTRGRNELGK